MPFKPASPISPALPSTPEMENVLPGSANFARTDSVCVENAVRAAFSIRFLSPGILCRSSGRTEDVCFSSGCAGIDGIGCGVSCACLSLNDSNATTPATITTAAITSGAPHEIGLGGGAPFALLPSAATTLIGLMPCERKAENAASRLSASISASCRAPLPSRYAYRNFTALLLRRRRDFDWIARTAFLVGLHLLPYGLLVVVSGRGCPSLCASLSVGGQFCLRNSKL